MKTARAASSKKLTAHAHRSIELTKAKLRLVVVADTHSKPHARCAEHISALEPDAILHAGDIGELHVLDQLETMAPLFAIRGNIDPPARDLPDTMTLDLMSGSKSLIKFLLMHIGVYGPRLRADAARLARSEGAALVICGHSHVPFIGRDVGLSIFNPGSVGPRRFQLPIVFGVMEIENGRLRMHHVDCETGQVWTP